MTVHSRVVLVAWAIGLVAVAGTLAGLRAWPVALGTVLFVLVAPGAALAGLMPDLDPLARLVTAMAASIVVNVGVATVMVSTGTWSPRAGAATIVAISGCLLAVGGWLRRPVSVRLVRRPVSTPKPVARLEGAL